jgi:hypothetical protein
MIYSYKRTVLKGHNYEFLQQECVATGLMVCVDAPSGINYFRVGSKYESLGRTVGFQAENLKRGFRSKN